MASCKQLCPLLRGVSSDGEPGPGFPALHPSNFGATRDHRGLGIAAVLVVLDFHSCLFLQGALREKGFQSGCVRTDLTWINLLWLDVGWFFRLLYSALPGAVLLSVLLFLLLLLLTGLPLAAAFHSTAVKTWALTSAETKPSSQPKRGPGSQGCSLELVLIRLTGSFVRVP